MSIKNNVSNLKKLLHNHSFKHKSIIVELFNYSFSHKPIEGNDNRFLGRNKLIRRIRSFINDTTTTSGAYLISGFRGIGKTSIVNKALAEHSPSYKIYYFFYYWLLSLVFLFNPNKYLNHITSIELIIPIIILIGMLVYLSYMDPHKTKTESGKSLFAMFIKNPFIKHKYSFLNIFRIVFLSASWLIYIFFIHKTSGFDDDHLVFLSNIKATLILFLVWSININKRIVQLFSLIFRFIISLLILTIPMLNIIPYENNIYFLVLVLIILVLLLILLKKSKSILNYYFGFNKLLIVKVNLGKDHLTDKDVLKYTTSNLLHKYKSWRNSFTNPYIFIIRTLPFLFLFLLLEFIASQNDISDFSSNMISETHIYNYFPSQVLLFDSHFSQNKFDKLYLKGVNSIDEYIDSLNKMYKKDDVIKSRLESIIIDSTSTIQKIIKSSKKNNWKECIDQIQNIPSSIIDETEKVEITNIIDGNSFSPFEKEEKLKTTLAKYYLIQNYEFINIIDAITEEINNYDIIFMSLKDTLGYLHSKDSTKNIEFTLTLNNLLKKDETYNEKIKTINDYFSSFTVLNKFKKNVKEIIEDSFFKNTIREINNADSLDNNTKQQLIAVIKNTNTLIQKKHKYYHKITHSVDYYFSTLYFHARWAILGKNSHKFDDFFPIGINYLLFTIIGFIWFLVARLDILRYFGIVTHKTQIRDLTILKDKINASLTIEKGVNVPIPQKNLVKFPLFYKKSSMAFTPLDTKDIENELMRILHNIQNIPIAFTKVSPLIIYDELDKIVSRTNTSLQLKDNDDENNKGSRYKEKRQETITNILSSLKAYLSSSSAKFIFIAGRDMYDAALAGISDRQSILDSIFHDNKIYIPSFYSETSDSSTNDISSMTEWFICRYLMPESYIKEVSKYNKEENIDKYYNLKIYYKYLDGETIQNKRIIMALNNLITYITYRSNGAPKKISTLFEEFVISKNNYSKEINEGNIVISTNKNRLHLKLDYHAQYRLSFISYLVTPIFFKLGNYISEFSDKILVSISYLLDHIFKFHKHGFSSQNLSLTPEIIDINKEPEFRPFLREILNELSVSHLRSILSGLHEYRFQGKIRTELSFLIKLSAIESAALNFTLDESLESKRYFNNKLHKLEKSYNKSKSTTGNEHVDSLALYHMTIGDLHFYDQEYFEAITNYQEAIQFLNKIPTKKLNIYNTVLLIKNSLKLALAFEKDDRYKEATLKYFEISDLILIKRDFPLDEIGLTRFVLKKKKADKLFKNKDHQLYKLLNHYYPHIKEEDRLQKIFKIDIDETIVIGRINNDYLLKNNSKLIVHDYKYMEQLYDITGKHLAETIHENPLNFNVKSLNVKLTSIEHIRLLYQPLVAKLYLLEKSSHAGINKDDIIRTLREFEFIARTINKETTNILITEFYNKIGDLLYYKNRSLVGPSENKETVDDTPDIPIDAFYFYSRGLFNLLGGSLWGNYLDNINKHTKFFDEYNNNNVYEVWELKNKILNFINKINVSDIRKKYGSNFLSAMANSIIDITNAYYSGLKDNKQLRDITKSFEIAEEILNKIGEYRLAKSQIIKILMIYISHIKYNNKHKKEFNKLVERAINYIYQTYNYTTVPESSKFKKIFKNTTVPESVKSEKIPDSDSNNYYSSLHNEIREIQILKLLFDLKKFDDYKYDIIGLDSFYKELNNHPYTSHKYVRILEHNLRVKLNNKLFGYTKDTVYKDNILVNLKMALNIGKNSKCTKDDLIAFLILDSIGCISESINIHSILGINYISTGNLTMAKIHSQMYKWHIRLENFKKDINKMEEDIKASLEMILETNKQWFLDSSYHFHRVIFYNGKAEEMHSQDIEYKNFMESKYYLDDDFNDNMVHFGIAGERFEMNNNKKIKNKFKRKEEIDESKIFDISSQVEDPKFN